MIFNQVPSSNKESTQLQPISAFLMQKNDKENTPDTIYFTYEDHRYSISMLVYENDAPIRLPDGRLLKVQGWYETMPPRPISLIPYTQDTKSNSGDAISE